MDRVIVVAQGVDPEMYEMIRGEVTTFNLQGLGDGLFICSVQCSPLVGVSNDWGEGLVGSPHGSVEHLRLELGELALELGVVIGQRLDDGRVPGPQGRLVRSPQILIAF